MFFRRALFYWQFTAAILLPLWVIVGQGLFGATDGWDLVLYIVLGLILGATLFVIAGITLARKQVRTTRSVSSQDAIIFGILHLAIIAYGFYSQPLLATVVVIMCAVAFWSALWQLFSETRTRVKNAFALPALVVDAGQYEAQTNGTRRHSDEPLDVGVLDPLAPGRGRVIVVDVDAPDDSSPDRR